MHEAFIKFPIYFLLELEKGKKQQQNQRNQRWRRQPKNMYYILIRERKNNKRRESEFPAKYAMKILLKTFTETNKHGHLIHPQNSSSSKNGSEKKIAKKICVIASSART